MSFYEAAPHAIKNKVDLFTQEPARFATRAVLAGVYLGIMTAFAASTAQLLDVYAPGWGKYAFGGIFASTLYIIIVLQGELATGDMMFMTYGAVHKKNDPWRGFLLVVFVTFFNLLGAVAISWLISKTTMGQHVEPDGFLHDLLMSKLQKGSGTLFVEAILANIVVNIAFMLATQAGKDYSAKLWGVILIIPSFATMSYEHSIANFILTCLGGFTLGADAIDGFTAWNVMRNWVIVWLGNFVGGGFIMGGIYGWLNLTNTDYKD